MNGSVLNITALSAVPDAPLPEGSLYYVESVRSYWRLAKTSTLTVDGITIATSAAAGRWLREPIADLSWAYVTEWFINATTGNDENDGQTALTPLLMHAELARRWGKNPLSPALNFPPSSRVCIVRLQTSLPITDPVNITPVLPVGVFVWYPGGVETVLYSGSITALTTRDPLINQAWEITDAALPAVNSWTTYIGARLRITTAGVNNNAISFVAKDLGARTARTAEWILPPQMDPATAASLPLLVGVSAGNVKTPIVGDTFNIEQMFTITPGSIQPDFLGNAERVIWGELQTRSAGLMGLVQGPSSPHVCYACKIGGTSVIAMSVNGFVNWIQCQTTANISILGGLCTFSGGQFGPAAFQFGLSGLSGAASVQNDTLFQATSIRGDNILIRAAACFDSVVTAAGTGGHGVYVGNQTQANTFPTKGISIGIRLWGSGNAGAGVNVASGCGFAYNAAAITGLTITGALGNFLLNNVATGRAWDEALGVYTAPIANTWANLNTPIGGGGFGGNAHDVATETSIVPTI